MLKYVNAEAIFTLLRYLHISKNEHHVYLSYIHCPQNHAEGSPRGLFEVRYFYVVVGLRARRNAHAPPDCRVTPAGGAAGGGTRGWSPSWWGGWRSRRT